MPAAAGAKRGCGDSREEGAVYLEVGVGPEGLPLEAFLLDPPQRLTRSQLASIPRVGVTLVEDQQGVAHVIDWVGEGGYPYAADFLEEGRAYGFSRKISHLVEVERLEPKRSTIIFVHPHGHIDNWPRFHQHQGDVAIVGHCQRPESHPVGEGLPCVRHLWALPPDDGDGCRCFVDLRYNVYPPTEALRSQTAPAMVARFPISNLSVIARSDGGHGERLREMQHRAKLPVLEAPI